MSIMYCHRCNAKAAIHMRQHRLILCKDHYQEWFIQQTERFIKKYHMLKQGERVLVAVSGGKDSLALWDVLGKLGFQADGLHIDLGIVRKDKFAYSAESRKISEEFAARRGLNLRIVDIREEYGESIPQINWRVRRNSAKTCSICGLVKRYVMNRVTTEGKYAALATGHNLDDEAAALFGNTFNWEQIMLTRQAPVLPAAPGLAKKIKPFCRFSERETAAYAIINGIQYIQEECPHAEGSSSLVYKRLLNQLEEEQPGAKLRFYLRFLKTKKEGFFGEVGAKEETPDLNRCSTCGQPTTLPDTCSFCNIMIHSRQEP